MLNDQQIKHNNHLISKMLPPNIEDYKNAEDYNKDYNYWEYIQKQQKQLLKEKIEDNVLILINVVSIIIILIGILTN